MAQTQTRPCSRRESFADEPTEEVRKEQEAEDKQMLDEYYAAANSLPGLDLPDEAARPFDLPYDAFNILDLSPLVRERQRHQTNRAAKSVRTSSSGTPDLDDSTSDAQNEANKPRSRILEEMRRMNLIQREFGEKSESTGLDRKVRWTGTAGGTTGNAANAALAAGARAMNVRRFTHLVVSLSLLPQVVKRRSKLLTAQQNLPNSLVQPLGDASVGSMLKVDDFGIILYEEQIMLARGKCLLWDVTKDVAHFLYSCSCHAFYSRWWESCRKLMVNI